MTTQSEQIGTKHIDVDKLDFYLRQTSLLVDKLRYKAFIPEENKTKEDIKIKPEVRNGPTFVCMANDASEAADMAADLTLAIQPFIVERLKKLVTLIEKEINVTSAI